jgi:hypothetical protein
LDSYSPFIKQLSPKSIRLLAGDKKLSETVQLEQLLNEKASVEDEGHELDEEQRQLKLRAKMLTEKIIQEIKKRNTNKQETVNTLQSKVNELESQLNSLSAPSVLGGTHESVEGNGETEEATETYEEEPPETNEDTVSVTEVADEIDVNMDSKEKKKRKFF